MSASPQASAQRAGLQRARLIVAAALGAVGWRSALFSRACDTWPRARTSFNATMGKFGQFRCIGRFAQPYPIEWTVVLLASES
jgi:hypothetical protein